MLTRIIHQLMDNSPTVRRRLNHFWYQMLSRIDTDAVMPYMNYGYADLGADLPRLALEPADEMHRYCIQLYRHVVSAVELAGCDVL
jgi:hypothetical protein